MNISSVKSESVYRSSSAAKPASKDNVNAKTTNRAGTQSADKLEISQEAQNLQAVASRINSGFYDKQEVLRETAEKLYNDINS
mgnify:CR=1 FL=1